MEKKKSKITAEIRLFPDVPDNHMRIKRLLQDLSTEFDILLNENLSLQNELNKYTSESGAVAKVEAAERPSTTDAFESTSEGKKFKAKLTSSGTKAGYKIRAQTNRIVSSFKTQSISSSLVRDFTGVHSDGVWEVTASLGHPLIATASADHLACIWGIDSARCLLKYEGHGGSVNSIKFHPSKDLLLTASGDTTAHIWLGAVNWENVAACARRGHSSEEELDDDFEEPHAVEERERIETLRTPLQEFANGHSSVVVAADWISSSSDSPTQIITASWDRSAILWDIETKAVIQTLTGHDNELTHCSSHQTNRLVVTSSRDSTFRLWDFRSEIPAVSVFQGHAESVTSTIFKDDKVISGSDDKSVKIWELRNMRAPLTTIRTDSPVNRLSVSTSGAIAIPHDNRSIRLFDLNGQRIARLQRTSRMGHRRMVSSVAWKENSQSCNLFSSGFDKKVFGWHISI